MRAVHWWCQTSSGFYDVIVRKPMRVPGITGIRSSIELEQVAAS